MKPLSENYYYFCKKIFCKGLNILLLVLKIYNTPLINTSYGNLKEVELHCYNTSKI